MDLAGQTTSRHGYIGRFAPSPTGDLHLGSLLAAVGSYADARHHGGRWLLRIEDLDTPRVVPGSAERILRTLEAFGLEWDGPVTYQSERLPLYRDALEQLRKSGWTFECSCSRRELGGLGDCGYPGTCRSGPKRPGVLTATRFRMQSDSIIFQDRVQGLQRLDGRELGDVVVRRKDDIIAYQLAVVVDDADQRISDVVRGADLLPSTGWQIALQQALSLPTPRHAHLPLVLGPRGEKLSKSQFSVPVDARFAATWLSVVVQMLNKNLPVELERDGPAAVLAWAVSNWNIAALAGQPSVTARDTASAKYVGPAREMD